MLKNHCKLSHFFNHIAIYAPEQAVNAPIIGAILKGSAPNELFELRGKKGVLFSNTTLASFIEEEHKHDFFELTGNSQRSIRTFSSGEQRKALLQYLLSQNPDFILLDNPFDALDTNSVSELKSALTKLSKRMPVLQIFKRRSDLLPFIQDLVQIHKENAITREKLSDFLKKEEISHSSRFIGSIPAPLEHFRLDQDELIRFDNVSVRYDDRIILNTIFWTVNKGEFWQLKGPNGSGKTTILSMINGDNPKAYGQAIYLFGKRKGSGESIWQIKKMIGYFSPSMMDLFKRRNTALQMVVSGLKDSIGLYKKAGSTSEALALKWLQLLDLESYRDEPFLKLNQVQRRLVLIARAMIKHPPLLILDEPSTGLDDKGATLLSVLINKMAAESKTAIIYVSHRKEPGLTPDYIYELIPGEKGSRGFIVKA